MGLHRYMLKKKELLEKAYPEVYDIYTEEDAEELNNWTEEDAEEVTENIVSSIDMGISNDVYFCPWCTRFFYNSCIGCEYRKRHGSCCEDDSEYSKSFPEGKYIINELSKNEKWREELRMSLEEED